MNARTISSVINHWNSRNNNISKRARQSDVGGSKPGSRRGFVGKKNHGIRKLRGPHGARAPSDGCRPCGQSPAPRWSTTGPVLRSGACPFAAFHPGAQSPRGRDISDSKPLSRGARRVGRRGSAHDGQRSVRASDMRSLPLMKACTHACHRHVAPALIRRMKPFRA